MVKTTPNGQFFLNVGFWTAVGGAVYGLISLGYYGFGYSSAPNAWSNIRNNTWSSEVRLNIQKTYAYLFLSYYICICSALFVFSHPLLLKIFSSLAFLIVDLIVESFVQRGKLFAQLRADGIFSIQKLAWTSYCIFIGAISASYLLNGIDIVQVSLRVSFTIIGALIIVSMRAPYKKYYNLIGVGSFLQDVIAVASIGATLIPVKYSAGALFFSISLYGGLIVAPLNILCHTQNAHVKASEANLRQPYCAPAMSVPILLNSMSFFTRIILLYVSSKQ